jgi:hypothetical protein
MLDTVKFDSILTENMKTSQYFFKNRVYSSHLISVFYLIKLIILRLKFDFIKSITIILLAWKNSF